MPQIYLYGNMTPASPTDMLSTPTVGYFYHPSATATIPATVSAARLVELVRAIREEWESDGVPLELVEISVRDMLDELDNLLEMAGIPTTAANPN